MLNYLCILIANTFFIRPDVLPQTRSAVCVFGSKINGTTILGACAQITNYENSPYIHTHTLYILARRCKQNAIAGVLKINGRTKCQSNRPPPPQPPPSLSLPSSPVTVTVTSHSATSTPCPSAFTGLYFFSSSSPSSSSFSFPRLD